MHITRGDGLVTTEQAAELCGVEPVTVRNWILRGYGPKSDRRVLCVAKRENGRILLDPIEVQKAEYHTRKRARRVVGVAA